MSMDEQALDRWRRTVQAEELARLPQVQERFETASGIEVKDVYTALDVQPGVHQELPGLYPMTRGIRANMYRNRPFTRRQVVGLGTARDANQRHKYVIAQGQTGLSNDFDLPTI